MKAIKIYEGELMKKNILTTLVAALVYFLCIGVGVLLGNLVRPQLEICFTPLPFLLLWVVASI